MSIQPDQIITNAPPPAPSDHPELPALPPVPTPLPPASWDEQQQAAAEYHAATADDRLAAMQAYHESLVQPTITDPNITIGQPGVTQ